jgi:hypothetical protein
MIASEPNIMLQKTSSTSTKATAASLSGLTTVQRLILHALARKVAPSFHGIGRPIPGVSRRHKNLEWIMTGTELKGKRLIKLGTYIDMTKSKAQRMADRVRKGLPAHA